MKSSSHQQRQQWPKSILKLGLTSQSPILLSLPYKPPLYIVAVKVAERPRKGENLAKDDVWIKVTFFVLNPLLNSSGFPNITRLIKGRKMSYFVLRSTLSE